MTTRAVTIQLPDDLYDRIRQRAEQTGRSIESEVVGLVASALPGDDGLPPELTSELASLALLDDQSLWRAARSHLSADAANELESLNLKQQREGLTEAESQTQKALLHQYDRAMLIRAQAAVLLKERGHDIDVLIRGE